MFFLKLSILISFLLLPSLAFAWGPLTHVYLGNELCSLGPLLPAGIYALLRKCRHDFLYGNIMADIIIGKKYQSGDKNTHSWDVALNLLGSAETGQQKAFAYGYLSHLAADTVAHEIFTKNRRNIGHTFVEMKADSIIDKKYWFVAMGINRDVQTRNDIFLEKSLERVIFSFKTNKRILKSAIFLSCLNQERLSNFIDRNIIVPHMIKKENIVKLHAESLDRMVDLIRNGEKSDVLRKNPSSTLPQKKIVKLLLSLRPAHRVGNNLLIRS